MRYLQIKNINQRVELTKKYFYSIVIENKREFRKFLSCLKLSIDYETDDFKMFEELEKLDLKGTIYFINSIYFDNEDYKKINLFVQKNLAKNINLEEKLKYEKIVNDLNEYVDEIITSSFIKLKFNTELELNTLLKTIDLSVEIEDEDFLSQLINKIRILNYYCSIDVFIFNDLHKYLSNSEINLLFLEMNRLEIYFINISSFPNIPTINERVILIDDDLAEIYLNFD